MKTRLIAKNSKKITVSIVILSASIAFAVDSDSDGLDDSVETNTGVFVSPSNTGTNPNELDSDKDGARDGWEVQRGSNPNSATSFPAPANSRISIKSFHDIAGTGISAARTYTHAISGGSSATVNGVYFDELSPTVTPSNFLWDAGGYKGHLPSSDDGAFGTWNPEAGSINDPELKMLLKGFTYSIQRWYTPTSPQRYTLSGLTKGQTYEIKLFVRVWDKNATSTPCPVDLTFTNGKDVVIPWGALPENRPDYVLGNQNRDSAYFVSFIYRAQENQLILDAAMNSHLPWDSASFHFYALTNEVITDSDGDYLSDEEEIQIYNTDPNKYDTDGDRLSDFLEIKTYGTNPTNADSDGDGFLDNYELLTGKSPLNSNEKPALVAEARTAIEFTFPSAIGKTYKIQSSSDLKEWTTIEDGIVGVGQQVVRFYSTRNNEHQFYRVEEHSAN